MPGLLFHHLVVTTGALRPHRSVLELGEISLQALSQGLRLVVSGNAQHYGLLMAIGVLVAIALAGFGPR